MAVVNEVQRSVSFSRDPSVTSSHWAGAWVHIKDVEDGSNYLILTPYYHSRFSPKPSSLILTESDQSNRAVDNNAESL